MSYVYVSYKWLVHVRRENDEIVTRQTLEKSDQTELK
jgi:hypothetical protein